MRPYAEPSLYWASALLGLLLALLTDGAGDVVALALLALPLLGISRALLPRRP